MVYVIADLHGNANVLFDLLDGMALTQNDQVIVAGDVGIHYGNCHQGSLELAMASLPCDFIVMRGNHDARYEARARLHPHESGWCQLADGMWSKHGFPNIKYVPDAGGVFDIGGKSVLFVPGGYSVDGWYRKEHGLPFEEDEELSYSEMVRLYDIADKEHYDYIISHVAPYALKDKLDDLYTGHIDEKAVSHFTEKLCNYFYTKGGFKKWVFGHYHADRVFGGGVVMTYNIPAVLD